MVPDGAVVDFRAEAWAHVIPSRLLWARTTDFGGEFERDLTEWALHPRGRNLIVFGPTGVGKSHAAVAAARHGFETMGMRTRFVPSAEMVEQLKPGGPDGYLWDLVNVDRLIIDDLGSERTTDWTTEQLYLIVNRRWLEERPTIVTTNLDPMEGSFQETVRADIGSRLLGSAAVVLRLSGQDRRMAP